MNKNELKVLKENGFVLEFEDCYEFMDFSIVKSVVDSNKLIDDFKNGDRVGFVDLDKVSYGKEFILEDRCNGNIWLCDSIEECMEIVDKEY